TARQLEDARKELSKAANLRQQLDAALVECKELGTQVSTLQQKADRVEPLEDELRSSRDEVTRLTQESAAKVERSELETVTRRVQALDEELRQAREELAAST